jgi:hypothetical protein
MRQPKQLAAKLPLARFIGTRWIVAMCETDWSKFRHGIASEANERLTVVLESFSEDGEAELPRGSFRWFARTSSDPVGVEMGAFEARGVVLQGRRAVIDGRDAFFVTNIVNDAPPPLPAKRKRRERDDRQAVLPLGYRKPKGIVT